MSYSNLSHLEGLSYASMKRRKEAREEYRQQKAAEAEEGPRPIDTSPKPKKYRPRNPEYPRPRFRDLCNAEPSNPDG